MCTYEFIKLIHICSRTVQFIMFPFITNVWAWGEAARTISKHPWPFPGSGMAMAAWGGEGCPCLAPPGPGHRFQVKSKTGWIGTALSVHPTSCSRAWFLSCAVDGAALEHGMDISACSKCHNLAFEVANFTGSFIVTPLASNCFQCSIQSAVHNLQASHGLGPRPLMEPAWLLWPSGEVFSGCCCHLLKPSWKAPGITLISFSLDFLICYGKILSFHGENHIW